MADRRIPQPAQRQWGPVQQSSEIARRSFTRERRTGGKRRLSLHPDAHDALRRIRTVAIERRRRLSLKSGSRRALDEIIAIADAAVQSTGEQ